MALQRKLILVVFLIFFLPSTVFAELTMKTGYDLYENIKIMNNPQSPNEVMTAMATLGYLNGYLDGLVLMQDTLFNMMLPPDFLSEKERVKLSKEINFNRLNIPKSGLHVGQLVLIYKKWAEKHPEKLNGTARICILESLVESYGWK